MKKSNRGFTLVETLIVSSFVVGTLVYLFSQFVILKNSYNRSFKYNTIENIYKAGNINKYLSKAEGSEIKSSISESNLGYIDISDCNEIITNTNYCNTLFNLLDIKTVLVANEDLSGLTNVLKNNNPYSEGLYQFVKRQKTAITGSNYRLVIEFNDETYATIVLGI